MKLLAVAISMIAVYGVLHAGNASSVPALTLEQALVMAEQNSPELREARALVDAAEGRLQQAGKLPNPELIVRAESLAATDGEYLAGVGQEIPVTGSIRKARQVGSLQRQRLLREAEAKRFELRERVHGAFATALYQSKAHEAVVNIAENSAKAVSITRSRVEAGDALPADLARIEMEAARTQAETRRSKSLQEQSIIELNAAIGTPGLSVGKLEGQLETVFDVPTVEVLSRELASHPAVAASAAAIKVEQARLELEKARRIPNIRAELLYRRIQDEKRDGVDVGFSVPLPLFDRNKGNIRAAQAEVTAAQARADAQSNDLHARVRSSHGRLGTALDAMRLQRDEVLPCAEKVLKVAEVRYESGDISLNEVLIARRDRAELELSHLEALREATAAWAELTGYLRPSK